MNIKTLRVIIIIWYICIAAATPILLGFAGYMLFGFAMSGFGSSNSDPIYLLLSALPFVAIFLISHKLHAMKNNLIRDDIRESVTSEIQSDSATLSPELTALKALESAEYLTLDQLSSRTHIEPTELLKILAPLIADNRVERLSSIDGILFRMP